MGDESEARSLAADILLERDGGPSRQQRQEGENGTTGVRTPSKRAARRQCRRSAATLGSSPGVLPRSSPHAKVFFWVRFGIRVDLNRAARAYIQPRQVPTYMVQCRTRCGITYRN